MLLYWLLMAFFGVVLRILWHIEVTGKEYLIKDRGFVIAANHISDLDPVFILVAIWQWKRCNIIAKKELFENPLIGWFLGCMGAVPIDRGKGDTGTLDRIAADCQAGRGLLIFPEGTRTKTGALGVLKSGAFVVAGNAGVDMIPCRIIYGTKSGKMRPFCRIRVCFGPTIPAEDLVIGDPRHAVAKLRELKKRLKIELETLLEQNQF